jgi:hypothetical protein
VGADSFCRNATVSVDLDGTNDVWLLLGKQHRRQRTNKDS